MWIFHRSLKKKESRKSILISCHIGKEFLQFLGAKILFYNCFSFWSRVHFAAKPKRFSSFPCLFVLKNKNPSNILPDFFTLSCQICSFQTACFFNNQADAKLKKKEIVRFVVKRKSNQIWNKNFEANLFFLKYFG